MYIPRICNLDETLKKKSFFLLGARQSGKSSYIANQLTIPIAKKYNLLDEEMFSRLSSNPSLIRQELDADEITDALVVIDEIQRCPQLLKEVESMIQEKQIRFLLTGSSVKKLKKAGMNLLPGRTRFRNVHPLIYVELKEHGFDLEWAMQYGLIPTHYLEENAGQELETYIRRYLSQEISYEGPTINISAFSRFLETAANYNTQLLNYTSIANEANVTRQTAHNYFEILKDTLMGYELEAFKKTVKRKPIETSKFYFFDMGVVNCLRKLGPIKKGSQNYSEFFEHFIYTELKAFIDYFQPLKNLYYWRSTSGFEVNFLIGNKIAIDVNTSDNISDKHLKGLLALKEENLVEKYIVISDEKSKRKYKDILIYPWEQFLNELWSGKLMDI